jgi:transposase-like protein
MNIIQIFKQFPTQESCVKYLEEKRWHGKPVCVYCGSDKVSNHQEKNRSSRLQCSTCKKSFSVTIGTIFHDSRLPLQKWFLAISLILNAKKGISSRQLARDIEVHVETAWSMGHRIRKAMQQDEGLLLKGIVEMDETYVGGKPRKEAKKKDHDDDDKPAASRHKQQITTNSHLKYFPHSLENISKLKKLLYTPTNLRHTRKCKA